MDNVERFIDLYKKLELAVRATYGINKKDSASYYLTQQSKFSKYKDDILLCSDTRNLIQHGKNVNNAFIVQPTEQMIRFIESLISKIKNRQRCQDIMINIGDVYWQDERGHVIDAMKIMKENSYTHVPVLENRRVVGVFDENSLFNYLYAKNNASIDDTTTFSSIKEYITLTNHEGEDFLFAKKNDFVDVIEGRINSEFSKQKRIGMVFITETGDANGRLQGILTPWDIIASYREI